ncbi:MAG: OmpH family outer membrane protein [Gammaproteobacteria bacterium]|nr:OmpH family outer membrane protein [Gammaproteobacteria bacterium]
MIKNLLSLSFLLFCLVAGAASAELKIAVVDTQRALIESEEAQALQKTMQEELKSEEDAARALNEEIQALTEQLQKDGEVMSPAEQRKAQKAIEDKQIDLQFMVNKLQKAVQDRNQELGNVMLPKIDAVLKDLIELEGYDLIVDRRNTLYVNPKHNITRKVTEKLNEKRQKSKN